MSAYVEIDGRNITFPEEFKITEKFSISDFFLIIKENVIGKYLIEYGNKVCDIEQISNYCLKLSNDKEMSGFLVSIIILIGLMIFQIILVSYYFYSTQSEPELIKVDDIEKELPKDFTHEQLREFNGTNDKPIYIALKGEIFDVTNARDYYGEGTGYHCFAGKEASRAMAKFSFEDEDMNDNVHDLTPFERDNLNDRIEQYKHYRNYPVVGKVSKPPTNLTLTKAQLAEYKGHQEVPSNRIDAPIYVVLNKKIIDVSYGGKDFYGKGGPYHIFAGIDASRALAKMSFHGDDLLNTDLSDLTEEQKKTLDDWEKKFITTRKYPVVGILID